MNVFIVFIVFITDSSLLIGELLTYIRFVYLEYSGKTNYMNKGGPIIIIEDDPDDLDLFKDVFKELNNPNEVIYFKDGIAALEYLTRSKDQAFLIISDINLPRLDGFALREKIHNNEQLRLKCIPYLFFTTAADQRSVIDAYSHSIQGFFTKPASYSELVRVIRNIVEYWKDCHSPNIIQ